MTKKDKAKNAAKATAFWAALNRVLDHAEATGEVYAGATEDHAALRAGMADDPEAEAALSELEDEARTADGDEGAPAGESA